MRRNTIAPYAGYDYPPLKDAPHGAFGRSVPVPWLQMRGHWLAAAGFAIGTRVRVRVTRGCLVLTVIGG